MGDAHPGAAGVVGGGVVDGGGARGVIEPVASLGAALPVELDFDALVAVGVQGLALQADDDGGLHAAGGGAGVAPGVGQAAGVARDRAHGDGGALRGEPAGVEGLVAGVGGVGALGGGQAGAVVGGVAGGAGFGAGFGADFGGGGGVVGVEDVGEAAVQAGAPGALVGADVVAGAVLGAQDDEAVAGGVGAVAAVVLGVVADGDGGAGGAGAQAAVGDDLFALGVQGLHLAQGCALALGVVFVGVGAGVVDEAEVGVGGAAFGTEAAEAGGGGALGLGAQAQGAVVGAGELDAGGVAGGAAAPAGETVLGLDGAGLGVADVGLGAGLEGVVVVGNHQGVGAEAALTGLAGVLEPAEEAFFAQEPGDELAVALGVLGAEGALGVDGCVGQVPAPGGGEWGLGRVVGKNFFDDLDDRALLEHPGVSAVAEEGKPRLDDQAVVGQAGVAAEEGDAGDVPMKRPQRRAAGSGEQLQQGGLADELFEFEVGVDGHGVDDDSKAGGFGLVVAGGGIGPSGGADGLIDGGAFGHEHVRPEGGVEHQEALVLRGAAREGGKDQLTGAHGAMEISKGMSGGGQRMAVARAGRILRARGPRIARRAGIRVFKGHQ